MAAALSLLGTRRSAVVCGSDGLDEVTLNGPTDVTLIDQLGTHAVRWTPADFGLSATTLEPLLVDGPAARPPSLWRYSAERTVLPATSWL